MNEKIKRITKSKAIASILVALYASNAIANDNEQLTADTIQSPEYLGSLAFNGTKPYLPYLFFDYDPLKKVYTNKASDALKKVIKYCRLDNGKIKWIYDGVIHYAARSSFTQALRSGTYDFRCYKDGKIFVPQKAKNNEDARKKYDILGKEIYIFETFEHTGQYSINLLMNLVTRAYARLYAKNESNACNDKQVDTIGIAYNFILTGRIIKETPTTFTMKIELDKLSNIILGCLNYKARKIVFHHKIYLSNAPLLKPIEYTLQFQKEQVPIPRPRPKVLEKKAMKK